MDQHTSRGSTGGKEIYISWRSGHSVVLLTGGRKERSCAETDAQTQPQFKSTLARIVKKCLALTHILSYLLPSCLFRVTRDGKPLTVVVPAGKEPEKALP